MREPSPRTSRLAIAGGLAAAVALVAAGFVMGRKSAPVPKAPTTTPAVRPAPLPAPIPPTAAVLKRSDLLAIAAQAADAFASNIPMPVAIDAAAGHRFNLVLPLGCGGPDAAESSAAKHWSFDPKAATLRISVTPVMWKGEPWTAPDDAGETAFQGFWIARPWSSATVCPEGSAQSAATSSNSAMSHDPTVAIARPVSAAEGVKLRSYEVVRRATAADFDPRGGFHLRIIGRLRSASEGGAVICRQPDGADQPPRCLIVSTFSEVRIESPKTKAVLASWQIDNDLRGKEDEISLHLDADQR